MSSIFSIIKNTTLNRGNMVAWGCRIINAGAQIVLMPQIIRSYGVGNYAALLLIASVMNWLMLLDLGLTLHMQNTISRRVSRGVSYEQVILSTILLVYAVSTLILVGAVINARNVLEFFHKEQFDQPEIYWMVAGYGLINIAANIVYRLKYAQKKNHVVNLIPTLGMLISGSMILLGTGRELATLINVWYGPTGAIILYFTVAIIIKHAGKTSWRHMNVTIRRSLPYGLVAIGGALVQQIDIFILTSLVSDINLIKYSVVAKVMTFFAFMANVIIANNWAPCAEASSARDWRKTRAILRNVIYSGLGIIFSGTFFCLVFNNTISTTLTDGQVNDISPAYWIAFSLLLIIRFWSDSFMMLIQGAGLNKIFIYYLPVQAAMSIAFQIIITRDYGGIGVILGQMIAFLLTSAWILPYYYKRLARG